MLDIIIIIVLLIFTFHGYIRGFIITLFNLFSFVLSITITYLLYPYVASILYSIDGLYDTIKDNTAKHFGAGITRLLKIPVATSEDALLRSLDIPDFLKVSLINNNKPEIHSFLNAMNIEEYVSGFIANTIINITAMLIVFMLTFIIMRIIAASLQIISHLPIPVLGTLNKMGGAVIGFVQGVFIVWLLLTVSVLFFSTNQHNSISVLLRDSYLAGILQNNNLIYQTVTNILK